MGMAVWVWGMIGYGVIQGRIQDSSEVGFPKVANVK